MFSVRSSMVLYSLGAVELICFSFLTESFFLTFLAKLFRGLSSALGKDARKTFSARLISDHLSLRLHSFPRPAPSLGAIGASRTAQRCLSTHGVAESPRHLRDITFAVPPSVLAPPPRRAVPANAWKRKAARVARWRRCLQPSVPVGPESSRCRGVGVLQRH